jgi:alkane 1-monooxygenase
MNSAAPHPAVYSRYTLRVKKYAYLIFLLPLSLPVVAYWIASRYGIWDLAAYYTPFWYFVLIPILDALIGQDPANPAESDEGWLSSQNFYRVLTLACLPLHAMLLLWGAWVFVTAPFSWIGQIGWIVSMGCVGGVAAINTGHELIHKPTRLEQWAGGVLLASVTYGTFKVEHIYGHHVDVATPIDGSTAARGESVYAFVLRALRDNPRRAFALEKEARARRRRDMRWWNSELVGWYAVSALFAAVCALVAGWMGLIYFVGQSLVAIALLEIINYVEHYGLARRQLANGRFERVDVTHSWNSNFLLTNLLLFQLQRHSDHHAHAARRYQALRHFPESPQLPAGYAAMVVLAVVPWLWRRVMDPRVAAYRSERAVAVT